MKCAGLPPACGQAALRTSGGSATFGTPSSTCSVRRPARIGSRLPGSGVLLGAEPVVPQAAAAERQRAQAARSAASAGCSAAMPITRPAGSAGRSPGRGRHSAPWCPAPGGAVSSWPDPSLPWRRSSSASCSSASACQGLSGAASAFSRASSSAGSPLSIWCCAHSRLARSRSSGSAEESPATLVPQRRGTRAGRPHPPSAPPRAAGRASRSPRAPSRPAGRTRRCRRCGSRSLLPAAVASARFIAVRYSTAAAWSCRASYQRQPCQPAAAPTIASAPATISPPYRFSSCCARSARSSSSTSSKMSTTWSPAIRC